jgi:hypothetical protein
MLLPATRPTPASQHHADRQTDPCFVSSAGRSPSVNVHSTVHVRSRHAEEDRCPAPWNVASGITRSTDPYPYVCTMEVDCPSTGRQQPVSLAPYLFVHARGTGQPPTKNQNPPNGRGVSRRFPAELPTQPSQPLTL